MHSLFFPGKNEAPEVFRPFPRDEKSKQKIQREEDETLYKGHFNVFSFFLKHGSSQ